MVNTRCPLPIFPAALPARAGQGRPPRSGSSSTDQNLSAHLSSTDAKPEELERRLHRAEYLANKECHQSRSFVRIHRRLVGSKPGTPTRERGWPYHRRRVEPARCSPYRESIPGDTRPRLRRSLHFPTEYSPMQSTRLQMSYLRALTTSFCCSDTRFHRRLTHHQVSSCDYRLGATDRQICCDVLRTESPAIAQELLAHREDFHQKRCQP